MSSAAHLPDVAGRRFGGCVVTTSDDFFADVHQLLAAGPAHFDPAAFAPRGKVYDGWETRRRRDQRGAEGDDFVIVRLGAPAVIRAVDIDTAHFRGNYPPAASVHAATVLGYPSAAELVGQDWRVLVDHAALRGDCSNLVDVEDPQLATHLKLTIHPDGGVARLRAYGEVVPDPRRLGGRVDVAAAVLGGAVEDCSNRFYAEPANVLLPGVAAVMSDGWETARRRDDGNDWMVLRLAAPSALVAAVIDTTRFVGNSPAAVRLTDADSGAELLPEVQLVPDTEHHFRLATGMITRRVRVDIYPDGGLSRVRLLGSVPDDERAAITAAWLSALPEQVAKSVDDEELFW